MIEKLTNESAQVQYHSQLAEKINEVIDKITDLEKRHQLGIFYVAGRELKDINKDYLIEILNSGQ